VKASPVIQAMTFFSINSINHREKPIFMLMQAIPLFYASHPMGCITVYSQIIDLHSYLEIYTKCPSPISTCNKFLFSIRQAQSCYFTALAAGPQCSVHEYTYCKPGKREQHTI